MKQLLLFSFFLNKVISYIPVVVGKTYIPYNWFHVPVQAENTSLKRYRENISDLANELARRTAALRDLRDENATLRSELGDMRHYLVQLDEGHADRMEKMRSLQDGHDALAVQLEGVRAQCACLEAFNRTLEEANRRLQV